MPSNCLNNPPYPIILCPFNHNDQNYHQSILYLRMTKGGLIATEQSLSGCHTYIYTKM